MKAMARNTPPANEFATPRILGDSLHDFDHVGIEPQQNPSTNARIQNTIFVQSTVDLSEVSSSLEASLFISCLESTYRSIIFFN